MDEIRIQVNMNTKSTFNQFLWIAVVLVLIVLFWHAKICFGRVQTHNLLIKNVTFVGFKNRNKKTLTNLGSVLATEVQAVARKDPRYKVLTISDFILYMKDRHEVQQETLYLDEEQLKKLMRLRNTSDVVMGSAILIKGKVHAKLVHIHNDTVIKSALMVCDEDEKALIETFRWLASQIFDIGLGPDQVIPANAHSRTVEVKFESKPSGASVTVDGTLVCANTMDGCSVSLLTGLHLVKMVLPSYGRQQKTFFVTKPMTITMDLTARLGYLKATTSPVSARIFLDSTEKGMSPVDLSLIAGRIYTLRIDNPCYETIERKVMVRHPYQKKNVSIKLRPRVGWITINARDINGGTLKGKAYVDGKRIGNSPGSFKIPICSKILVISTKAGRWTGPIQLLENGHINISPTIYSGSKNGGIRKKKLIWRETSPEGMFTWKDAKKYCEHSVFRGIRGWRLPTISELKTLIKGCKNTAVSGGRCSVGDGCASLTCFSRPCYGCKVTDRCYWNKKESGDCWVYWTASKVLDKPNYYWTIDFTKGSIAWHRKEDNLMIKCVRQP